MSNAELVRIFNEMAAILELQGADRFRINAHTRVAQVLHELSLDVTTLADDPKALVAIDGIGKKSAEKIVEFVKTGEIDAHQALRKEIPVGLLDLLKIPGLGPKTVRMMWERGGVTDLESLEEAIDSGTLEKLPRMGAKTIQNIRDSIAFLAKADRRTRIGQALPLAELIVRRLRSVEGATHAEYAGSLRRGRETVGDIDIIAVGADPAAIAGSFCTMPGVEKVLVSGPAKCSVRIETGLQVDLRVVGEDHLGAALMYFTGSKAHSVVLRERAVRRGLRLNEYGLFRDDGEETPPHERGVEPIAARTEAEIYAALELPWMPPEVREDRGEIATPPPPLVEASDIVADLHMHTTASDGRLTIEEMAEEAMRRGLTTIAITDHSPASAQAGGLEPERLASHVEAIREVDARLEGITILAGTEVDILADGHLDYDDDVLATLDLVVASPHVALRQTTEEATKRLLRAIEHPLVNIIGHPTGRVVGKRAGLEPDLPTLVAAALEHGTAMEVNANFMRLDLRDTHVRAVTDAGGLVSINCDAHDASDFDMLGFGLLTARRGWLTAARCVNSWDAARIRSWARP